MSKRVARSAAALFLLMFLGSAQAQKQSRSPATAQHRSVAPHLGTIAGNVYFNERFRFSFSFPKGMILEPPATKPLPMSSDELAYFAPDKAVLIEQSGKETSMIFHAADPASELTRLAVFAEDVSQSQIRTANQYASRETGILKRNRAGIMPVDMYEKVRVGQENFERRDLQSTAGGNSRYDIGLYGIVDGHALTLKFIATTRTESERIMNEVVSSFRWNAAPITAPNAATLNGGAYIKNQVYYNEFLGLTMPLLPTGQVSRTDTLRKMAESRGNPHAQRMGGDEIEFIMSRDEKDLRVLQLFVTKLGPKDLASSEEKDAHAAAERMGKSGKASKPAKVKVAGLSMYVLDIEEQRGAKTGYMRMYLVRHKGHGLMFQALSDSAAKLHEVAAHFENTASFTNASAAR